MTYGDLAEALARLQGEIGIFVPLHYNLSASNIYVQRLLTLAHRVNVDIGAVRCTDVEAEQRLIESRQEEQGGVV